MSQFHPQNFINFAVHEQVPSVVGIFPDKRTLKSGRESLWYVNWRGPSSDVHAINRLADFVLDFAEEKLIHPDCFYGVPEGATKIGVITQFKHVLERKRGNPVLPFGRGGAPKGHGDPRDSYFVGAPSGSVLMIEDVTTTGLSLLEEICKLKRLPDVNVIGALALTNRLERTPHDGVDKPEIVDAFGRAYEQLSGQKYDGRGRGVEAVLSEIGIPYFALSTGRDLLHNLDLERTMRGRIDKEFEEPHYAL